MNKKTFTKTDIKFIVFLLFVAGVSFIFWLATNKNKTHTHAEIMYKGNLVKTVDLNTNSTFSIPEKPHVVFEVKDGEIRFVSSDCPDKICVKTGFIKDTWQISACLPNDLIAKIVSDTNDPASDIDTIVK